MAALNAHHQDHRFRLLECRSTGTRQRPLGPCVTLEHPFTAPFRQSLGHGINAAMLHAAEHYELERKRALDAAERAATSNERIRHLIKAHDYAQMAIAERQPSMRRLNVSAGPTGRG